MSVGRSNPSSSMKKKTSRIPGIRFYPTDVELVKFYLKRKIMGKRIPEVISEVNIYKFSPWDLPDKAILKTGDLEWHFLSPKEMKYANGLRSNRAVEGGYWKSTGKDRPVRQDEATVGMIKTLVFHLGHAPKGDRTNWVIHEYRIEDPSLAENGFLQDSFVLCKLFQKSGLGPKNGEQHGAPFKEEDWESDDGDWEEDEPLLPSDKLVPELQFGGCSYATVEAPAVRASVEDVNNTTAMLERFTSEDFAPIWDNNPPMEEMPENNGTGVVMEEPVADDGNDIFSGLDDLGDWRGGFNDNYTAAVSTMDYDYSLCIGLDDLDYPLEGGSASTQQSQANHCVVHPNSSSL